MDNELKQYLAAMEERLGTRLDGRLEVLEGRVDARFEGLEERVNARIEKVETNLLTAFHGWARAMEIRVRGVASVASGFDERLALAEERISELERRRN